MARASALLTATLSLCAAALILIIQDQRSTALIGVLVTICLILPVTALASWLGFRRAERQNVEEAESPLLSAGLGQAEAVGTARAGLGLALGIFALVILIAIVAGFTQLPFWSLLLITLGGSVLWSQLAGEMFPLPRQLAPWQRLLGKPRDQTKTKNQLLTFSGAAILLFGAIWAILSTSGSGELVRTVQLFLIFVLVVFVIIAPTLWRTSRRAAHERAERIRTEERAELAAHLHDSVLQTLALIQRRNDNPATVSNLARQQEHELRAWLSGSEAKPESELTDALRNAAAEVERHFGGTIDVASSGRIALDDRLRAVVAAAREAMTNAAKHAAPNENEQAVVNVFVEINADEVAVFIRDRGNGFDQAQVPADRRGISESIEGRMQRIGGTARIFSKPESGTEVELLLNLAAEPQPRGEET